VTPRGVRVVDPADGRLDAYRHLRDADLRRRLDGGLGMFVVEGTLALAQLVASPYEVDSVLVAEGRLGAVAPLLEGVDAPLYVTSRLVLAATVGFDMHRGVVAVGRRRPPTDPVAVAATPGALVVLEAVNDHENLGTLFRTARALGATGVLVDPTCADPLYRRSVRVSLGHVLRLPWATVEPWPEGLVAARAGGRRLVALAPDPTAVALADVEPGPVALMVGAEGPGLSAAALATADLVVRIPMAGDVDSLNVATAAGIALHHLVPTTPPPPGPRA
jgi:tRNA G18 (ribose-2'-O)-methylase SpoU